VKPAHAQCAPTGNGVRPPWPSPMWGSGLGRFTRTGQLSERRPFRRHQPEGQPLNRCQRAIARHSSNEHDEQSGQYEARDKHRPIPYIKAEDSAIVWHHHGIFARCCWLRTNSARGASRLLSRSWPPPGSTPGHLGRSASEGLDAIAKVEQIENIKSIALVLRLNRGGLAGQSPERSGLWAVESLTPNLRAVPAP
jgi:hypothetical protein